MPEKKLLNDRLGVRINKVDKETFVKKCSEMDREWGGVLREVIVAFNENRLRIAVPKSKLDKTKDLYHVNRK